MPVAVKGTNGGGVTLDAGAAASNTTLTLPNTTGTVALTASPTFTGTTTFPGSTVVDSSGNVGIGTSSPTTKLQVQGSGSTYVSIVSSNVASGSGIITTNSTNSYVIGAGAASGSSGLEFRDVTNLITRMIIDSSGNLLVGYTSSNGAYKLQVNSQIFATSSTIATSDARYKQNVETLNGALSIVKALRPVSFDWKKHPVHAFDTENTTVGFLAQEVQQVLADKPYLNSIIKKNECVIEPEVKDENGDVTTAAVTEEFLGIAEGNMIAILTSALQELSVKNDALEARLAALEAK
jgi:hypothetical protein